MMSNWPDTPDDDDDRLQMPLADADEQYDDPEPEHEPAVRGSHCDKCGEFYSDLDAGFSAGKHHYIHGGCGGEWKETLKDGRKLLSEDEVLAERDRRRIGGDEA